MGMDIMVTVMAMDMDTGPTDTDLMVMARERLSLATTGMDIMVIVVTDMDTGPMATEATMARERPRLCPSQDTITDITDTDPMVMDTGPMEDTEDTTARERLSQFTDMVMEVMEATDMDIMETVDMVTEEDTTMVKPKLSFTQYVLSSVLEPFHFQNFKTFI